MKINKNDIEILRKKLTATLPTEGSDYFQLGYKENIESFLYDLETFLRILINYETNEADVDIADIICSASDLARVILNLEDRNEFLKGAELAEKMSFECLHSYLEKRPTKPAA